MNIDQWDPAIRHAPARNEVVAAFELFVERLGEMVLDLVPAGLRGADSLPVERVA